MSDLNRIAVFTSGGDAPGMNALLQGDETAHLRRVAPRTLLVAITNACNLTCDFCYRDL